MPAKQHIIALSGEERASLEQVAGSTRRSVWEKRRARILLESDTNVPRAEGGSQSDLRLIRERLIELEVVEDIAMETIRQTLKKTRSSRG